MTTRESIQARIETLNDEELDVIQALLDQLAQSRQEAKREGILERLSRIQYEAPPDFSTNWEHYLNEDLDSEADIR